MMSKVYIELICDNDVADELMSYSPDRVDIIAYDNHPNTIIEMGGERYIEKGENDGVYEDRGLLRTSSK